jgi:hypothetical protein
MIELDTVERTELPGSDPFAPVDAQSPVLAPPNPDGLTLSQLEDMLSDLRFQPRWREEADKAADYYDGHQLAPERLERMARLGIPPLTTNLIRPAIDAVLGLEAKTRTDWRVVEEDYNTPVPEPVLNALNQKLTEAERESNADRAIADAHASQIKAGLGWVEVARATDAMDYPYRVTMVDRREIFWDWRAKKSDLTDARYLIRKRRFDQDELIAMMPEHAEVIRKAVGGGFRTWQFETRDLYDAALSYAAEVERVTNLDEDEWRDAERKRATLFEVWHRVWIRGKVMKLPNGRVVPFNPIDQRHVAAVEAGIITPYEATYSEVRVAFYLGPHQLYDFKSPYTHRYFPYVPFWGFREDKSGVPYGLIRGMMSPQDVVNSADAKMHWMLSARRLIATSDSIDTRHNSWRQVQDELARPDAVVLLDPNKPTATFKVDQDFQLNTQQYQRRMQASSDIQNAGGIYSAMMGQAGAAESGTAINALIEQGSVTLAKINDGYRFARRQVGEMLFSLVREDLMSQPTTVHVLPTYGNSRQRQPVGLNQPNADGGIDNNVALVNAKVVLSDVPSTPAFRAQQLMVLSEVVKSLPPEMQMMTIDVLVKLTDVPEKELLIERLRRAAGIQDIAPEEEDAAMAAQQQAAAEATELLAQAQQANIEVNLAKAEKLRAETEKIIREAGALELDMQARFEGSMQSEDPAALDMREALMASMDEVAQMKGALQEKMSKIEADIALKKYQIDGQLEVAHKRADSEHAARMVKANQTPAKPGK